MGILFSVSWYSSRLLFLLWLLFYLFFYLLILLFLFFGLLLLLRLLFFMLSSPVLGCFRFPYVHLMQYWIMVAFRTTCLKNCPLIMFWCLFFFWFWWSSSVVRRFQRFADFIWVFIMLLRLIFWVFCWFLILCRRKCMITKTYGVLKVLIGSYFSIYL